MSTFYSHVECLRKDKSVLQGEACGCVTLRRCAEAGAEHSLRGSTEPPCFTAALHRPQVLISNDSVLASFLKKANPNLLLLPSCPGPESGLCFLSTCHSRKDSGKPLPEHTPLSPLALTAGKSDVWTYPRGEGDPSRTRDAMADLAPADTWL